MKILMVEDNADLRDIYCTLFKSAGHETQPAINGIDGLEKTMDFKPDLIMLDLLMPEMSGYGFLQSLHSEEFFPFIVVVSQLSAQSDKDMALASGAHGYLGKSDFIGQDLVNEVLRLYDEWLKKQVDAGAKN